MCIHSPQTSPPRTSSSQRCTVVGYNAHMLCASLHDLNFAFSRLEILMFDFPSHSFIKPCMAFPNMASGEATLYHSSNQSAYLLRLYYAAFLSWIFFTFGISHTAAAAAAVAAATTTTTTASAREVAHSWSANPCLVRIYLGIA